MDLLLWLSLSFKSIYLPFQSLNFIFQLSYLLFLVVNSLVSFSVFWLSFCQHVADEQRDQARETQVIGVILVGCPVSPLLSLFHLHFFSSSFSHVSTFSFVMLVLTLMFLKWLISFLQPFFCDIFHFLLQILLISLGSFIFCLHLLIAFALDFCTFGGMTI